MTKVKKYDGSADFITPTEKCKRCYYEDRLDPSIRRVQFCPDLDGYFNLCMKCGTPERSARGHKLVGAVFD